MVFVRGARAKPTGGRTMLAYVCPSRAVTPHQAKNICFLSGRACDARTIGANQARCHKSARRTQVNVCAIIRSYHCCCCPLRLRGFVVRLVHIGGSRDGRSV